MTIILVLVFLHISGLLPGALIQPNLSMNGNHLIPRSSFAAPAHSYWMYSLFKTIHIIGVVILIGNVTITAYWKVLADRTSDTQLIAHAQQGVTVADWIFTLAGIILILAGGYGAAGVAGLWMRLARHGSSLASFYLRPPV